jgi:hypothetical protein
VASYCDWLGSDLRVGHFFSSRCPLVNTPHWTLNSLTNDECWVTAHSQMNWVWVLCYGRRSIGQSANLSWNKSPIWGLRPDYYSCQTVAGLLLWGALSDERTGLSFTIAGGPRQRSLSRVRVPWDWRPYLLSYIRDFPFRRLVRLAGLRWRYSTPLPHGSKWTELTLL